MNDSQVKQQIQQMVSFIKQEADDKANEIRVKAEEDFNIRKLSAVEAAREKIRSDYERKEKQIDVNRRIAQSTEMNAARLEILKARDAVLREVYEDAAAKLGSISTEDPEAYLTMLSNMVLQGLIKLGDSDVSVRCRTQDIELLTEELPVLSEKYLSLTGKPVTVEVDAETPLGDEALGGVVLLSEGGKIVVENTFMSRVEIAFQQNLPQIRGLLFG